MHIPPALHIFPLAEQSTQGTPPTPQALFVFPGWHVLPFMHPVQMHCWAIEQVSPVAAQSTHALPMLPHELSALPWLQVLPAQQPVPQVVMSQTQVPVVLSHPCPTVHAGPLFCHWPQLSHFCGWSTLHCTLPGVHCGWLGQEQAPHVHDGEHVWVPYVLQGCMVDWAQTPWPMHVPATHVPPEPHVSVSMPQLPQVAVRVWPGAHVPLHTPATHV